MFFWALPEHVVCLLFVFAVLVFVFKRSSGGFIFCFAAPTGGGSQGLKTSKPTWRRVARCWLLHASHVEEQRVLG